MFSLGEWTVSKPSDFPVTTFDAVFFDLDSTLVDELYIATASIATCAELAAAHPQLDAGALATANLQSWVQYWGEVEQQWIVGELSTPDMRHEVWRRTFAAVGAESEELITEALPIHQRHERAEYLIFPDALPTIDALRAAGIKVGVITNGATDTQREKLDLLGITDAVDTIIVSAEVGAAKPSPVIFEAALAAVGVSAARAAHVGDSLHADIGGAVAAGVTAIWLNRTGAARADSDPIPDREIASLAELVE